MKEIYINDLVGFDEGKPFDSFFLVLGKQQRMTKQNKPYLNLVLGDKTGQLEGRVWELNDPRIAKEFERGDTVKVRGSISKFDERCQIKVDQLRKALPEEVDKGDLLPSTTYDIALLWGQLEATIASITNPDLKRLLATLLDDPAHGPGLSRGAGGAAVAPRLAGRPAGARRQPARAGRARGRALSALLDRDLLVTGVILHDIGKMRELMWETGFDYTVEGVLLGHIQMGVDLVEKTIAGLPDFPDRLRTLVLHMILSHHGKLEFGSPKLPMIPEAMALNFVDDLDAKMQAIAQEFEKSAREGKGAGRADGQGVGAR